MTTFVDDMADRAAAKTPKDTFEKVAQMNKDLDPALETIGCIQHPGKAATIANLRGPETYEYTRKMQKELNGVKDARYLGPHMVWNRGLQIERTRRIKSTYNAYYMFSRFWKSSTRWSLKRLVFKGLIKSKLLSGLSAFLPTKFDFDKLDAVICKLGRKVMKGGACAKDFDKEGNITAYYSVDNSKVRKFMQIATTEVELQVERLKMLQNIARDPKHFDQYLTTIFGRFALAGTYVTQRQTQIEKDLQTIEQFDDHAWLLEATQGSFLKLIKDDEFVEEFLKIDFSKLKKAQWTVAIPPPGWAPLQEAAQISPEPLSD